MTNQEIIALLDLEKILVWGQSQKPLKVVGYRQLEYDCPLAHYLMDNGVVMPRVHRRYIQYNDMNSNSSLRRTTFLSNAFVLLADLVDGQGQIDRPKTGSGIQARTFVKFLKKVIEHDFRVYQGSFRPR